MYFKERDLVKYSDGRVFIVRKATEEFAVLTMLTQLENTNEYFYTGVNITASNREGDYINKTKFNKIEGIILYNQLAEHVTLDEMMESIKNNKPISSYCNEKICVKLDAEKMHSKNNLETYLRHLEGITYRDWIRLSESVNRVFKNETRELEKNIQLSNIDEVKEIILQQFGQKLD